MQQYVPFLERTISFLEASEGGASTLTGFASNLKLCREKMEIVFKLISCLEFPLPYPGRDVRVLAAAENYVKHWQRSLALCFPSIRRLRFSVSS